MKKHKHKRGLLVVISGPSGVGKSTVVARLLTIAPKLRLSISSTTRPPRAGEREGVDYHFINKDEFDQRIKDGDFLEWAKVHGHFYGTSKSFVSRHLSEGDVVVLEVDVQGATNVRELWEKEEFKARSVVFIFLIPPSVDILKFRLRRRKTETEDVQFRRMRRAIGEFQLMERYDYIVVNDRVEAAADKILAIINVEKERTFLN